MNKNEKFQWGDDDIIRGKMNKTMETKMKKCDEEFWQWHHQNEHSKGMDNKNIGEKWGEERSKDMTLML